MINDKELERLSNEMLINAVSEVEPLFAVKTLFDFMNDLVQESGNIPEKDKEYAALLRFQFNLYHQKLEEEYSTMLKASLDHIFPTGEEA